MSVVYLVTIAAYDIDGAAVDTLYYANGTFNSAPSDTPANQHFAPRLKERPWLRRSMFSPGKTGGKSTTAVGELVLINDDGGLDGLIDYAFDGRVITVYRGENTAAFPGGFTKTLVATASGPASISLTEVRIPLRDRQTELDKPLQSTLYAGNNALPAGLEGVAGDLKGKPKPLCYGTVRNISPPLVNTSKLIYQVNDGAVSDIDVYDRGVTLGTALPPVWTTQTLDVYSNYEDLYGACYSTPLKLWALASNGVVWTSPDAITWTMHWLPSVGGTVANWKNIIWGRGLFIASGDRGGIAYSPNGIDWTLSTSPFSTAEDCSRAAYSASLDLYAIGGTAGKLYTSTDGISWTSRTSPLSAIVNDILWSDDGAIFVTAGDADEISTSADGVTWTARTSATSGGASLVKIDYSPRLSLWCMVAPGWVQTSPDGITWTYRPGTSGTLRSVLWTPWNVFIIAKASDNLYTSPDGITWTAQAGGSFGSNTLYDFATDGTIVVGCCNGKTVGYWETGPASVYSTQADLLDDTLAPPPGAFGVYLAGGYFRLGSTPIGTITADVVQGSAASDRTGGQLSTDVLLERGMTSADWNASDITALDAANASVLGFWSGVLNVSASDVLSFFADTLGAWWGFDKTGIYRTAVLLLPSSQTATISLVEADVWGLDRVKSGDARGGIPTWRQTIRCNRNYTPQTDLAGAVSDVRRAALAETWESVTDEAAAVKTAFLLAREETTETAFSLVANAATEAARRQVLRGTKRDTFEFWCRITATTLPLDLGTIINLTHSRFGLSAGKNFAVIGVEPNPKSDFMRVEVWG